MFLYHPVTRELLFSETEYVTAVFLVLELTVPFSCLGQDLDLSLFEDFLHVVLNIGDELKLPVVPSLEVLEVQDEWDCPF